MPVFAFGQSHTYSWYRPGPPWFPTSLVHKVSRAVGAVPLVLWGVWGTPLPHQVPVTVVVGKPIEVPKVEHPSNEEVQKYLDQFIEELVALFERNKEECGCSMMKLRVY